MDADIAHPAGGKDDVSPHEKSDLAAENGTAEDTLTPEHEKQLVRKIDL